MFSDFSRQKWRLNVAALFYLAAGKCLRCAVAEIFSPLVASSSGLFCPELLGCLLPSEGTFPQWKNKSMAGVSNSQAGCVRRRPRPPQLRDVIEFPTCDLWALPLSEVNW